MSSTPQYSNIVGIVGSSFRFGMGSNAPSILATPDGQLYFNAPIQIRGRVEGQPYIPAEDDDLVTLAVVQALNSATYTDACNFAKNLILQYGGSGEGSDPENPPQLIIQNQMPDPVIFDTLRNGYSLSLGVIEREKYLHQIVLELEQIFKSSDDARYEVAIGNDTTPNAYVDWFEVTGAQKSLNFDVFKTIHELTEVKLFVRDWIDPNPWVQRILNPHETTQIAIQSFDAKKRIYEVTITCGHLYPDDDVVHTDIFGGDVLGKGYLDFGIPIKLKKSGHYRIVQIDNPALAEFDGIDPEVDENEGIWSKTSEVGPFPSNFDEEAGAQYFFLLGQSRGENDWTHIYVYDLDNQDGSAIWVFHVKNEIMTITPEEPTVPIPEGASFVFRSASEGTMTSEKQEDGTYIVNVSGEILDKKAELEDILPGISEMEGKFSSITATFTGYTGRSFRFICQNPAYEYFYGPDGNIQFNDGVYYVDSTLEVPEDGTFSVEVLVSDKPGDINIIVIGDPSTTQADLVTIANNVTFIDQSFIPDPTPDPVTPDPETPEETTEEAEGGENVSENTPEDAPANGISLMSANSDVATDNVDDSNDRDDTSSGTGTTGGLPVVVSGRARVRMLVF